MPQQFKNDDQHSQYKKQYTDAVDAMHVFNELCFGPVWIGLADVEVFRYLF